MSYHCKTPFCNTTDAEKFTASNKSVCKSCLSQRRVLAKNTLNVKNTNIPSGRNKNTKSTSSLMNIISTQQKMLENQQRQTDTLLSLTGRLLDKVTEPRRESKVEPRRESKVEPRRESKVEHPSSEPTTPVFRPPISHTPRKRSHLVHYKDRLNSDI